MERLVYLSDPPGTDLTLAFQNLAHNIRSLAHNIRNLPARCKRICQKEPYLSNFSIAAPMLHIIRKRGSLSITREWQWQRQRHTRTQNQGENPEAGWNLRFVELRSRKAEGWLWISASGDFRNPLTLAETYRFSQRRTFCVEFFSINIVDLTIATESTDKFKSFIFLVCLLYTSDAADE